MMKPEPVPWAPLTLIMTTLGSTRAAMPATEFGGRLFSPGGTVPRLYPDGVPAAMAPMYPPSSPPASADMIAVITATTKSLGLACLSACRSPPDGVGPGSARGAGVLAREDTLFPGNTPGPDGPNPSRSGPESSYKYD